MNFNRKIFLAGLLISFWLWPALVFAADSSDNILVVCNDSNTEPDCQKNATACFWWGESTKCASRTDTAICSNLPVKLCGPNNEIGSKVCKKSADGKKCEAPPAAGSGAESPSAGAKDGVVTILPACARSDNPEGCRNLNDLVQLIVNFGQAMFMIVGMFAFVFFVYGGFTMIFSFGNPEKVKNGRNILVAALTGLLIVFSAYFIINFMLDALGVEGAFRVIK